MAAKGRDAIIAALEAVHAALKDLDPEDRKKVLSSVFALLGLDGPPIPVVRSLAPSEDRPSTTATRPISLTELVNDKKPRTNQQRIALFGYYREKGEGLSRFSRVDLKSYFAKAKLPPASNYDRDFVEVVRRGWIHEDGADSYLTTRGIEAVEAGFEGEQTPLKGRKSSASAKRRTKQGRPKRHRKSKSSARP
jgi:hypothetical protein